MKTLVLYYSRTGTTKKVGEEIAKALKADSEEIVDLKNRDGPIGWVIAGKDAMRKNLTKIKEISKDIKSYDLIVVGTPNWAGTMTPAIRTFLDKNKGNIKKVAFFSTMGGANPANVFIQMEECCTKPISIMSVQTKEVKDNSYLSKVENFVNLIKNN